ncbi:MAG: hypothetical protein GXO26_05335 [Crenarchaeota archaeon]|nr:hypothetical protein [Thermoproteota archaeon]
MRRSLPLHIATLLTITLFTIACTSVAFSTTLHGTLYVVYSNGTKIPLTKVVKKLQYYTLKVYEYPSMTPVTGVVSKIFPNSSYVIENLQSPPTGKVSYVIYLVSPKGSAPLYRYDELLGKYVQTITIPPLVSGLKLDLYVMYKDLLKIMYVVYVPVLKYVIVQKLPNTVTVGKKYLVIIKIENTGNATGTVTVAALLDSKAIFAKIVNVSPSSYVMVTIPVIVNSTGTHVLIILINHTIVLRQEFTAIKISRVSKIIATIIKKIPKVVHVGEKVDLIVQLKNIGNATGTAVLKLAINGKTVKIYNITLEPEQTYVKDITLMFNRSGTYEVVLYLNETCIFYETVRAVYYVVKVKVPSVNTYVGSTFNIGVKILNSSLTLQEVDLEVTYNTTMLKLVNVSPGACGGSVSYSESGSTLYIEITGMPLTCIKGRSLVEIFFKAVKAGISKINVTGTAKLASGAIATIAPAEGLVKVSKYLECDFNHNGRLDIGDVVIALEVLLGKRHSNVPCDLNHNGRLDIGDIVLLLMKILRYLVP